MGLCIFIFYPKINGIFFKLTFDNKIDFPMNQEWSNLLNSSVKRESYGQNICGEKNKMFGDRNN